MPMALSLGLGVGSFASMGNGDGFEWDPNNVTAGIDFQTDRVFDGEATTSDYSAVLIGGFDPAAVSSDGMELTDSLNNEPEAAGWLLEKLKDLVASGGTVVFFWRQSQLLAGNYLARFYDSGDSSKAEIYHDTGEFYATDFDGSYEVVGMVRSFSDNVVAITHGPAGWLSSLNGETAVLDDTQTTELIDSVAIGFIGGGSSSGYLNGWLKAIIFYDSADAAGLEAYSANSAPENTVAPVITGNLADGGSVSVSAGTWTGSPTGYEYQWYLNNTNGGSEIVGETSSTLEVQAGWASGPVYCVVYAMNATGIGGIAVRALVPVPTVAPVVSGTPAVGQLLTTTNGTWDNSPTSYTYKWLNDNGYIVGATAQTYTVQGGDVGLTVGCEVTAINDVGPALSNSNFVGPVS